MKKYIHNLRFVLPLVAVLLSTIFSVLLVGCSAPGIGGFDNFNRNLNPLFRKDVIGTYQNPGRPTRTLVFLENGVGESHVNGKKEAASAVLSPDFKWKVKYGREVHVTFSYPPNATAEAKSTIDAMGLIQVYRIDVFGKDLKTFAIIIGGKRQYWAKAQQRTFRKIK